MYGLLKSGKSCRGGVPSPPVFCAAGAGCRAANSRRQRDCCLYFPNPEAALYGLLKSGKSCRGGVPSPPIFCAAGAGCRAANSRRQCVLAFNFLKPGIGFRRTANCGACVPNRGFYLGVKNSRVLPTSAWIKSCRGGVPSPPVFVQIFSFLHIVGTALAAARVSCVLSPPSRTACASPLVRGGTGVVRDKNRRCSSRQRLFPAAARFLCVSDAARLIG